MPTNHSLYLDGWMGMDQTPVEQLMFAPGSLIAGRYEVISHLGSGGMGVVVKVVDRLLENDVVALKFLYPHLVRDKTIFARFRNELLVTRKLAHPNIVQLYDFNRAEQGYYFISMEYVEGCNLRSRLHDRTKDKLRFSEILRILSETAQGLSQAHSKGIIHRDLKPDNILLSEMGVVKVADFGLARVLWLDKGLTETGNAVGTPQYMAPEQIRGEELDVRCDIYSLGILAYELVVGKPPFNEESWFDLAAQHMREPIPSFASEKNGIPEWYEEMVMTAAEKKREDRYSSVDEIVEILNEHIDNDPEQHIKYTPLVLSMYDKDNRRRRKRKAKKGARILMDLMVGAIATIVILGGLFGVLSVFPSVNDQAASMVLRTESAFGLEWPGLKRMLGIQFARDADALVQKAAEGNHRAVEILLGAGLNPDSTSASGKTGIELATLNAHVEVIESLVAAGANVNLETTDGLTPLMLAVESGSLPAVDALLKARPHLNARNRAGQTAVMLAAEAGQDRMLQAMLERGAFANLKDLEGRTALMFAARSADAMTVTMLLDKKADLNTQDASGLTPLMHALAGENKETAEAILTRGPDLNVMDVNGRKAINYLPSKLKSLRPLFKQRKRRKMISMKGDVQAGIGRKSLMSGARLKVRGRPVGKWRALPDATELVSVTATVKNVGSKNAIGVRVIATLPGGNKVVLSGPGEIPGGESREYSLQVNQVVRASRSLQASASCENCR